MLLLLQLYQLVEALQKSAILFSDSFSHAQQQLMTGKLIKYALHLVYGLISSTCSCSFACINVLLVTLYFTNIFFPNFIHYFTRKVCPTLKPYFMYTALKKQPKSIGTKAASKMLVKLTLMGCLSVIFVCDHDVKLVNNF